MKGSAEYQKTLEIPENSKKNILLVLGGVQYLYRYIYIYICLFHGCSSQDVCRNLHSLVDQLDSRILHMQ